MFTAPNSMNTPPRAGANRKTRGGAAIARAVLESLETRRLMSIAINGSVTLDESDGLQTGGIAVTGEDNNDNDVAVGTLPASFSDRLFGAGGLALSSTFATQVGVAQSAANYIVVSETGTVVSLGFAKADGTALPVYAGVPTGGVASGLSAVTGGAIELFADPVLGNRMVLGVDAAGDIVTAMFMEPNATLTSAKVWTVQLEPLLNPDATNFDDPVTMAGLGVAAGVSTEFNFNALPSGQNLFGTVGSTTSGLVVIGKLPVLNADGTFTNASNTINTSQGGGPTTIGVNNQMFDPNEGAYFTFIKNPVADFLAGAPGGLDQNEADDADNIQYTGGTIEANGGFVRIAQIQGNDLATLDIKAFDMAGSPQGSSFATTGLGTGAVAPITAVRVFNADGVKIEDSALGGAQDPDVTITFTGGVARVSGVDANYKIEWDTSALHDQVLITGVVGKFDIGGFGVNQPTSALSPLTGVRFEDDGPAIDSSDVAAPVLMVDETDLGTNATFDAGELTVFFPDFGQDGSGNTTFGFALATAGGNSGLVDTATGLPVFLFKVGDQVVGKAGADATAAASGPTVFTVSIDSSGLVTLDQQRAIVHPDATDPNDSVTLFATGLVVLTATATDADGDTTQAMQAFDASLVFKDDGPSITASAVGAPTLTVDETNLAGNSSGAFAAQFTPVFGADGAGATPVDYALSTPGGDSGLVDTATGLTVFLFKVGDDVVGKAGADAAAAAAGPTVFVVSVDASGVVTLDQQRAIVHPDASDPDESKTLALANLVVLTATANDKDDDSASAPLNIGQLLVFKDDGPSITATIVGAPTLTVDETILLTNASGGFAAQFTPLFGADGAGATPVTYALSTPGGNSGLVDTATGLSVFLFKEGDDVVGKAGADATAAASGPVVFVVSVNASGVVTLDQQRAIVHPTSDPDESKTLSAADLVVLTATATDKDNDSASAPLNIGQQLVFKDDGPTIGPIDNSIVDLVAGATVTKTLNGAVGADPNAAPYTIDSFTASIVINDIELRGVLSANKQVVTYYEDTNGDTIFGNAGDVAFYRLTLDQTGAGTYTFEVLVDPPPAELTFNFDALPSGQNLFGTVGSTDTGLVVIGKVPVLNADGTFTNASNTINTSKGGGPTTIGVNNQMFDAGEGAYFTFVKNPVADFLAGATDGLDQNEADDADNIQYTGGTLEVNTAFVQVSQIQGNSLATMDITCFDMAGSPQGQSFTSTGLGTGALAQITAVRVFNAAGVKVEDTALGGAQDPNVVITIGTGANGIPVGVARIAGVNANFRIEWDTATPHDQVLVQAVGGKFDIGGFGTTQLSPTPDQKLDFVAKVLDGDGDSATSGFSIGIDGTGIFDDGVVSGVTVSSLSSSLFSSTPIDEVAALLA